MGLGLVVAVVVIALAFTYINGFHDTANSIATVVATKVLSPRQAVVMAAVTNLIGALSGTAVAKTIAEGLINTSVVAQGSHLLFSALLAACIWNLVTWWWGLPSSSSHALIGGLVGGALAASNDLNSVIWWVPGDGMVWDAQGVIPKVILPMVVSPIMGFAICFALMLGLYLSISWLSKRGKAVARWVKTPVVNAFFGRAQIASAAAMGLSHGMNDAQKTMGIVALALAAATSVGSFDHLPAWLGFLHLERDTAGELVIPMWIVIMCALVMAAGTAAGGWRIIKTLGHKMVRLHPINGFVAETGSALVIVLASLVGIPVSTTQCVSAGIMGVGAAKRSSAIRWNVVERMLWAWIMTMPVTALLAWGSFELLALF